MNKNIDLIIFDLGNVLIRFNEEAGLRRLEGHFLDDKGQPLTAKEIGEKLFAPRENGESFGFNYRTGKQSHEAFLAELQTRIGDMPMEMVLDATTNIFSPLYERWQLFHSLIAQGYEVALLSDTCPKDIAQITTSMPELLAPLPESHLFYSYDLGTLKKPGPDSYQHIIKTLGADPKRTLMIDDLLSNKPGADLAGINFVHVQPDEDLQKILAEQWDIVTPVPEKYIRSTAVIFVNDKGQVPLIMRDDKPIWWIFGGLSEYNETFFGVAKREGPEETNFSPEFFDNVDYVCAVAIHDPETEELMEITQVFRKNIGDATLRLGNEGLCMQYFNANELPQNMQFDHRLFLQQALALPTDGPVHGLQKVYHKPVHQDLADRGLTKNDFYYYAEWTNHDVVQKKRRNQKLRWDPFG